MSHIVLAEKLFLRKIQPDKFLDRSDKRDLATRGKAPLEEFMGKGVDV